MVTYSTSLAHGWGVFLQCTTYNEMVLIRPSIHEPGVYNPPEVIRLIRSRGVYTRASKSRLPFKHLKKGTHLELSESRATLRYRKKDLS